MCFLSLFFWLHTALFFFLLLLLFFVRLHRNQKKTLLSLRKKTALLSLSLSLLSQKKEEGTRKNSTRDLDFTQEELITHHNKKKNRTERSLFTLSLSLVLFSKTNKLFSRSVVFAKTSRGGVLFFFFISLLFFFLTLLLLCFDDDDDDFEEEEEMCFSAFVRTVISLFLERD